MKYINKDALLLLTLLSEDTIKFWPRLTGAYPENTPLICNLADYANQFRSVEATRWEKPCIADSIIRSFQMQTNSRSREAGIQLQPKNWIGRRIRTNYLHPARKTIERNQ